MPRAHRHFLSGQIWHITHRCHKKEFLLKFVKDRQTWTTWLRIAVRRHDLSVLNYVVTSNHIHLLVRATDSANISSGLQLIAGRTAQTYNRRKERPGAFWEDRYHATAIETDEHLWRCLVYIDLNMVRAGVVTHPELWTHGGYQEIQSPRTRHGIIDHNALLSLGGHRNLLDLQAAHREWVSAALIHPLTREPSWSTALAVGKESYVEAIRQALGIRGRYREIIGADKTYTLREADSKYRRCGSLVDEVG